MEGNQNNHTSDGTCQICREETIEKLKKLAGGTAAQQPCPSCGYCPTCGKARNIYPAWDQQYRPRQTPIYWTSTGTQI